MHADTENVFFCLSNKVTEFSAVRGLGFRKMAKQIIEFLVKATSILSSIVPNSIATRYLLWPGLNRVPQNIWAYAIKRCPTHLSFSL